MSKSDIFLFENPILKVEYIFGLGHKRSLQLTKEVTVNCLQLDKIIPVVSINIAIVL